jgi:hypothetical protein
MNLNGRKLGAGCSSCGGSVARPTNNCDPRKVISITRAGDKVIIALDDCTFLVADKESLDPSVTGGNNNTGKCECGKEIAELEKKITDLEKKITTEPKELGELVPVYNAKGELSYYAHAAPAEPGDPVPPPDLPSPPSKMSKVIFKRVDLPPEGWNLDTHATILGELTGKVGSEIPTTIYDEYAKSSKYLKFVSSDFTPPMYFPDSETPTVFTITMQRLPIQAEDGAADAQFKFIEQGTNKILKEFSVHGTVGFKIPTTKYDEALTELQNQGYELVSTTFDSSKIFKGSNIEDTFETIMGEHVVPFDPNTPVRPNPKAPDGPNDPMEPRV